MNPEQIQSTGPVDKIPATISSAKGTGCTSTTLGAMMGDIKNGQYADKVAAVRGAEGDIRAALKSALPGFILGEFSIRRKTGLVRHAGVIGLDVDDITPGEVEELRSKVAHDPHLVYFFKSVLGHGAKVGISVDPGRDHADSWDAACDYFVGKYGVTTVDPACKDVTRLCFVSDDPHAIITPGPVAWVSYPPQVEVEDVTAAPATTTDGPFPPGNVPELLAAIPTRPSYDQWLRVISAVGSVFRGDEAQAIVLLKKWSPEEDEGEYQDKLDHRLHDVGIASLVLMAQENGWKPSAAYNARKTTATTEAKNTNGKNTATKMLELLDKLSRCEFGVGPAPQKPIPRLLIGETTVATPGNLMTISAQAKSGKSALIGGLIASIIAAEEAEHVLSGVDVAVTQPTPGEVIIHAFP